MAGDTCTCGGSFRDPEDWRDHMPCPGSEAEQLRAENLKLYRAKMEHEDAYRRLAAEATQLKLERGSLEQRVSDLKFALGSDAEGWFARYQASEKKRGDARSALERIAKGGGVYLHNGAKVCAWCGHSTPIGRAAEHGPDCPATIATAGLEASS